MTEKLRTIPTTKAYISDSGALFRTELEVTKDNLWNEIDSIAALGDIFFNNLTKLLQSLEARQIIKKYIEILEKEHPEDD